MALALLSVGHESRATVAWPMWLYFDSADHGIACPADQCVAGYIQEVWTAGSVGVGAPVWRITLAKWEVEATGSTPAYRVRIIWPHATYLPKDTPLVWTLTAYGMSLQSTSPRSAPTPETVILPRPVRPATATVR